MTFPTGLSETAIKDTRPLEGVATTLGSDNGEGVATAPLLEQLAAIQAAKIKRHSKQRIDMIAALEFLTYITTAILQPLAQDRRAS